MGNKYTNVCHFCSMQDKFTMERISESETGYFTSENLYRMDYPNSEMGLCPRGNFCYELLWHPERMVKPLVEGNDSSYDDALSAAISAIKKAGGKVAILLNGSQTLEEGILAGMLAEKVGSNLISLSLPEDEATASLLNRFSIEKLEQSQAIVSFGDIFTLHPTISRIVHNARRAGRRNFLAVVDNSPTTTSQFAFPFIQVAPGDEVGFAEEMLKALKDEPFDTAPYGVSNDSVKRLITSLKGAKSGTFIFANTFGHFPDASYLGQVVQQMADAFGDAYDFCSLSAGSNSRGLYRLLATSKTGGFKSVASAIENGDVNLIVALGCDPAETMPWLKLDGIDIIQATPIHTNSTRKAIAAFPVSYLFEKNGTLLDIEEKLLSLPDGIPAQGSVSEKALLLDILRALGSSPRLPERVEIEELLKKYTQPEISAMTDLSFGDVVAIGQSSPQHHGDGSLTRRTRFNIKRDKTDSAALIGEKPAKRLGLSSGDTALFDADGLSAELQVNIVNYLDEHRIIIPNFTPSGRTIFGERLGPTPITIKKI